MQMSLNCLSAFKFRIQTNTCSMFSYFIMCLHWCSGKHFVWNLLSARLNDVCRSLRSTHAATNRTTYKNLTFYKTCNNIRQCDATQDNEELGCRITACTKYHSRISHCAVCCIVYHVALSYQVSFQIIACRIVCQHERVAQNI